MDWLGDIGGLYDCLYVLGHVIVAQVSHFALRASLLESNFSFVASDKDRKKYYKQKQNKEEPDVYNFKKIVGIKAQPFVLNLKPCRKNDLYVKMQRKAELKVNKQLDMVKFLQRQRLLFLAVMSLLKAP